MHTEARPPVHRFSVVRDLEHRLEINLFVTGRHPEHLHGLAAFQVDLRALKHRSTHLHPDLKDLGIPKMRKALVPPTT